MVGVYGVTSYNVRRQRREYGIRLALGADPGAVQRLIVRRGAVVALRRHRDRLRRRAAADARRWTSMLNDVKPTDPAVFAGNAAMVLLVSMRPATCPRAGPGASIRRVAAAVTCVQVELHSSQLPVTSLQFAEVMQFQSLQSSHGCRLPTANCQLPTANCCKLPTAYCLLPALGFNLLCAFVPRLAAVGRGVGDPAEAVRRDVVVADPHRRAVGAGVRGGRLEQMNLIALSHSGAVAPGASGQVGGLDRHFPATVRTCER